MRIWGVNFRGPAALNKAAMTALTKDKAVRVHKVEGLPFPEGAKSTKSRKNAGKGPFSSDKKWKWNLTHEWHYERAHKCPKDPPVLKISTESKFTTGRKIATASNSKTLRRVLRSACFSREKRQENGTDSNNLRR